jgi:hypothetical protein
VGEILLTELDAAGARSVSPVLISNGVAQAAPAYNPASTYGYFSQPSTLDPNTALAATFTNGSASIGATNSYVAGQMVQFMTTGALPTNFAAATTYYVISAGLSGSAFEVSATLGGSAITAGSAGSGTQTVISPWATGTVAAAQSAQLGIEVVT